jgi:hypothetical protein
VVALWGLASPQKAFIEAVVALARQETQATTTLGYDLGRS